jgi:tRNA nucleotidyltransferase (CCA-adding enzyme)
MANFLLGLAPDNLKIVKLVGQIADKKGMSAYLVGGVVRDLMLKRKNFDLDFVVEGNAIELAQEIALKKNLKMTAYKQFGTATTFWKNGLEVDFVSSRKEIYAHSGALPQVEPGRLDDDIFRRDFTVNALALSINAQTFGQVIDIYEGLKDLQKKIIRVLHKESFIDDPTRILRAVRFAVRLNFKIEPVTLKLMGKALKQKVFKNVKPPRLFQELKKNLMEQDVAAQVLTLKRLNILSSISSGLRADQKKLNAVENFVQSQAFIKTPQWLLTLMTLVSTMKPQSLKAFLQSIQLQREYEKAVLETLSWERVSQALNKHLLKPGEVYMILRSFRLETLDYFSSQASVDQKKYFKRYLEKDGDCCLKIDGNDLQKLGFSEGKKIKGALENLLLNKINGNIKTKSDELKFARSLLVRSSYE